MFQLLGFFTTSITAVIAGILQSFGRKGIVATASLSMTVALAIAFTVCIGELATLLITLLDFPVWLTPIFWIIPGNFAAVMGALISGHICRAAYDLAMEKVRLVNSAQ